MAKKPTLSFGINHIRLAVERLEPGMPYVGVSQQSFNMRLNIISPEPIKAAHCAALDTSHVWEYYVRDNVNADFAYRNRFQYGASIDSEDSSYCSDL